MREIVIVGSLNADLVQRVERVPHPGETVLGNDLQVISGGKGGNQAFAAGQLGGATCIVGNVGSDQFAPVLLESLQGARVDTRLVERISGTTGTACILVLPNGENLIVVSPGANGRLTPEQVRLRLEPILADAAEPAIVLCQLEIPLAATAAALETAHKFGATTMLDPAPAQALDRSVLSLVDYLTPNQTEAATLLRSDKSIETVDDAKEAAKQLLELGPAHVLVKLGSLGCVVADADGCEYISGFEVEVHDTTAAGDTFNGALAVALSEGRSVSDAIYFANAAAALSVTRSGAQSSIPNRSETDTFLQAHPRK